MLTQWMKVSGTQRDEMYCCLYVQSLSESFQYRAWETKDLTMIEWCLHLESQIQQHRTSREVAGKQDGVHLRCSPLVRLHSKVVCSRVTERRRYQFLGTELATSLLTLHAAEFESDIHIRPYRCKCVLIWQHAFWHKLLG